MVQRILAAYCAVLFSVVAASAHAESWYNPDKPALFGVTLGKSLQAEGISECGLERTSEEDLQALIGFAKLLCQASDQGDCGRADDPELEALLSDGIKEDGALVGDYKRLQEATCWRRCKGGQSLTCNSRYDKVDPTNPLAARSELPESTNPYFGGFVQRGILPVDTPLPAFVSKDHVHVSTDRRGRVVGVQADLQPQNQAGVLAEMRSVFGGPVSERGKVFVWRDKKLVVRLDQDKAYWAAYLPDAYKTRFGALPRGFSRPEDPSAARGGSAGGLFGFGGDASKGKAARRGGSSTADFLGLTLGATFETSNVPECTVLEEGASSPRIKAAKARAFDRCLAERKARKRRSKELTWTDRNYCSKVAINQTQFTHYLADEDQPRACWRRCAGRKCGVKYTLNATSSNKAAASALFAEALKQVGAKGNERKTAYELARDINEVQTLAKEVASEDFTGYFVRKMNFGDAPPPAFITGDPVFLSDRNGRLSGISVATLAERREEGRAALIAKYGKPDNISERTEILRSGGEVLLETLIWNRPDVIVRYEPVRSDTIGLPPEKWSG